MRPLLLILPLLAFAACGKSKVEQELDKFRAEGKPVTLEDLGLPKGGYESPEWKEILAVSEELKKDEEYKKLKDFSVSNFKFVGPGVAQSSILKDFAEDTSGKKKLTWEEFEKGLISLRISLSKLQSLDKEQEVLFVPDYYQGVHTKVPNLISCLEIVKGYHNLIVFDLSKDRIDDALSKIQKARSLKSKLTLNNTLIDGLVDVTCDGLLLNSCWAILQKNKLTSAQLKRLQDIWEPTFEPRRIFHIWEMERIGFGEFLLKIKTFGDLQRLFNAVAYDDTSDQSPATNTFAELIPIQKWLDSDLATFFRMFHENEINIQHWEKTGNFLLLKQNILKQQHFWDEMNDFEKARHVCTRLALPTTNKAMDKFVSSIAQQRMLQTAVALKRFHLANKRYPTTSDELLPAYLPSLPLDPIDGKPLRYRLEADGTYTLYSVGMNGIDDNGNGEEVKPEKTPRWKPENTYDIVWPQLKQ